MKMPTLGGSIGQQVCLDRWGINPASYKTMLSTKITKAIGLGARKCQEGFATRLERISQATHAQAESDTINFRSAAETLLSWGVPVAAYANMSAERVVRAVALGEKKCQEGFALKMAAVLAAEVMAGEVVAEEVMATEVLAEEVLNTEVLAAEVLAAEAAPAAGRELDEWDDPEDDWDE